MKTLENAWKMKQYFFGFDVFQYFPHKVMNDAKRVLP